MSFFLTVAGRIVAFVGVLGAIATVVAILIQLEVIGGPLLEIQAIKPEAATLTDSRLEILITGDEFDRDTMVSLRSANSRSVILEREINSSTQIEALLTRNSLAEVVGGSDVPIPRNFTVCVQDGDDGKPTCLDNSLTLLLLPITPTLPLDISSPTSTPTPTDTSVPPTSTPTPTNTPVPPTSAPRPTNTLVPPTSAPRPINTPITNITGYYVGVSQYSNGLRVKIELDINQSGNLISGSISLPGNSPIATCGIIKNGHLTLSYFVISGFGTLHNVVAEAVVEGSPTTIQGTFTQYSGGGLTFLHANCLTWSFLGSVSYRGDWSVRK